MRTPRIDRRALLAGAVFLTGAAPATEAGPVQTVRALYASAPRPIPLALLSVKLRTLIRRDQARAEPNLDFEWLSGGQERPVITALVIRLVRLHGPRAEVSAAFLHLGERRLRRFELVLEGGRWRVDDAQLTPENGRLTAFLTGRAG